MEFNIRPYHPADMPALYRVCMATGDSGQDGSHLYPDPDLLPSFFVGPYVTLEPEICFVLTGDGEPCGYMLGCRDVEDFRERCEAEWFPPLRRRYALPAPHDTSPSAQIARLIHEGIEVNPDYRGFPAALHIDLMPHAQRQGYGRRLMARFLTRLREVGVSAVHLEVSARNRGAITFYERVGFRRIRTYEGAIAFGRRLE